MANTNVSVGVAPKSSTALTPVQALKNVLNAPSVQEQFKNALKERKDAFVSSIIDLYSNDTNLQKCSPQSVCKEVLKAATLDLPVNKALGFSYILPYGTTPTFIVGYKGYIQLAQRTGMYKCLNADVVYEGELVNADKLTGEITFDSSKRKSNKVVGYFAYFQLLNGFSKTLYMTLGEMIKYAKRYSPLLKNVTAEKLEQSAQGEQSNGVGWLGNFNMMAIKTVVRRLLSKYGYLSIEMQNAITNEVNAEASVQIQNQQANSIDVDAEVVDEEPTQGKEGSEEEEPEGY